MSDRATPKKAPWLVRLALILPLILAAFFPMGVMPTEGRDGHIVMVLCSGNGPMLMQFDPATGAYTQVPAPQGRSICDWAAAQAAFDLTAPIALPVPANRMQRAGSVFTVSLWRPAHDPRGIWARGPPSSI